MQIIEEEYYHIHKKNFKDDMWYIGNEIKFTKESYNIFFEYYLEVNMKQSDNIVPNEVKIKEYSMMIRELIYEEVRKEYFRELPSRRHCIWLCDRDNIFFWENTLEGECDIYKVLATGNIHKCYAGALDSENINYKILWSKALSYWKGECIGNFIEKEYLFEGTIKIIDKL